MKDDPERLAVEAAYDACLNPNRWKEVIQHVAAAVDAAGGHFALWDASGTIAPVSMHVSTEEDADDTYGQDQVAVEPRRRHLTTLPIGTWVQCDEVVAHHGFQHDKSISAGRRHLAEASLGASGSRHAILAIRRPLKGRQCRPFSRYDMATLGRLTPHLKRAAHVHVTLTQLHSAVALHEAMLDSVPRGLLVVDEDGGIQSMNKRASAWLGSARGGLTCRGSQLSCSDASIAARLRAAIRRAVESRLGGSLELAAADGLRCFSFVCPLSPDDRLPDPWQRPLALVVLSDAGPASSVESSLLSALFKLTAAESQVARLVAAGLAPAEIAARGGTSVQTVRAQMQAVFLKTGVRRQSELSALLHRLAG